MLLGVASILLETEAGAAEYSADKIVQGGGSNGGSKAVALQKPSALWHPLPLLPSNVLTPGPGQCQQEQEQRQEQIWSTWRLKFSNSTVLVCSEIERNEEQCYKQRWTSGHASINTQVCPYPLQAF